MNQLSESNKKNDKTLYSSNKIKSESKEYFKLKKNEQIGKEKKKNQLSVTNNHNKTNKKINQIPSSSSTVDSTECQKNQNNILSLKFVSGNPFVEVTKGIIHYYPEIDGDIDKSKIQKSELILILQVPISITTHDLLQFTGPVSSTIERIRIIRDSKPNQYMALIKFQNQKSADEFFVNFNGVPFNSIEPEVCKLVYVERMEFIKDELKNNASEKQSRDLSSEISMLDDQSTCTVCLEKMDQNINAILTILCNHSFHSICLIKWGDQSCPLCRFSQTPEHVPDNYCFECGSQQDSLWMCITCGHIGCGRYIEGHAYLHYNETSHNFSMQVGQTNRVWDYAADNYVNRLLQTNDGKPVEVVDNCNEFTEKLDAMQLEYTYLLTNQLESQRNHYEQLMKKIEDDAQKEINELEVKNKNLQEEINKLNDSNKKLEKDREKFEKKYSLIETKYKKLSNDLKEEKQLGKCMLENQKQIIEQKKNLENKIELKDKEIVQFKDQLRDLMFYLGVQKQFINHGEQEQLEEIKEGKIMLTNPDLVENNNLVKTKNKHKKK